MHDLLQPQIHLYLHGAHLATLTGLIREASAVEEDLKQLARTGPEQTTVRHPAPAPTRREYTPAVNSPRERENTPTATPRRTYRPRNARLHPFHEQGVFIATLSRSTTTRCPTVRVEANGRYFSALIDTGASDNFIQLDHAPRTTSRNSVRQYWLPQARSCTSPSPLRSMSG